MICSKKHRERLPFDIQDRAVIFYDSDSPSDFEPLKSEICERIQAIQKHPLELESPNQIEGVSLSPLRELTRREALLLIAIAEGVGKPGGGITGSYLQKLARQRGLSAIDIEIDYHKLRRNRILETRQEKYYDSGEAYEAIGIAEFGQEYIGQHRRLFDELLSDKNIVSLVDLDEDIPF